MARYALTVTIRVGLDRGVHLLNVLRSHPPSISQASLGQDLKHKMVAQWGGPNDGEPSEYRQLPSSCCGAKVSGDRSWATAQDKPELKWG